MQTQVPPDWPNRDLSRIIRHPVHEWHVQETGSGPKLLMLHGAGGSVHSFAELLPCVARDFHALAPDLPGHGFTRLGARRRSGLASMAEDLWKLCDALGFEPEAILGHSAGGAVALEMVRTRPGPRIIGINPALSPFEGIAGVVFPAMAKMLAAVPFTSKLFAGASSRPDRIKALLDSTGSQLDADAQDRYRKLVAREAHVNGTLSMMAQWSLDDLLGALSEISAPALFITGSNDQTVPPAVADRAAAKMQNASVEFMEGYGHLIHEEAPDVIAAHCRAFLLDL